MRERCVVSISSTNPIIPSPLLINISGGAVGGLSRILQLFHTGRDFFFLEQPLYGRQDPGQTLHGYYITKYTSHSHQWMGRNDMI